VLYASADGTLKRSSFDPRRLSALASTIGSSSFQAFLKDYSGLIPTADRNGRGGGGRGGGRYRLPKDITTRNLTVNGDASFRGKVRFSGLAGAGDKHQNKGEKHLLTLDSEGNAGTSKFTVGQLNQTVRRIPKLENAIGDLGRAVETTGAIAASMSALPEVTLGVDEPVRCGFGTGGFGSQYAVAAGCALRVANRLHLNGALSYAPSVDYGYGSTPSFAGRFGFSFPIGGSFKSKATITTADYQQLLESSGTTPQEWKQYQIAVASNISQLQSELEERDEEIELLQEELQESKNEDERQDALIQQQGALIRQLEDEKRESHKEDEQRDALINTQQQQIAEMQAKLEKLLRSSQ